MGIEGQVREITKRAGRQLALANSGVGKDYMADIRRFPLLEREQEYALAKRWRERAIVKPATSRDKPFAARSQDRDGIPRLRSSDSGNHLRRKCGRCRR